MCRLPANNVPLTQKLSKLFATCMSGSSLVHADRTRVFRWLGGTGRERDRQSARGAFARHQQGTVTYLALKSVPP